MNAITEAVWSEILAHLRDHQPELVRGWFSQLTPTRLDQGVLEIQVTGASHQLYLDEHCTHPFTQAAQAATGHLVTVHFVLDEAADLVIPQPDSPLAVEEETDTLVLNPTYTFDQFVTGPCNRLAHAACVAVSESPGRAYNPLFLHGSVGLGKTHLLQAACHRIREVTSSSRVSYLSCETFMNHFIEAVERGGMHTFRYRYRHVDVLVIDDIQFLAARERSQEEFFHTFNTLYQLQKQIILSADCPPTEIPSLEDRLVSRFNWGLVARMDTPCFDTRVAIIRKKSKTFDLSLSDEVVHSIARGVTANARELEGALARILAAASQADRPVDIDLARQALGQAPAPHHAVTIPTILEAVTKHYGVRLADLQGRRRNRSVVFPRQVCMYLARTLTNHSLEEIGGYFGGRDHSTVVHATRTIERLREQDPEFRSALNSISDSLRQ